MARAGFEVNRMDARRVNPLDFASIAAMNGRFVEALAGDARARKKAFKDSTDGDAVRAIDAKEKEYKVAFAEFWGAQGMTIEAGSTEADAAWKKVRKQAIDAFVASPLEPKVKSVEPLPEPPPPPREEEDVVEAITVEPEPLPEPPPPPQPEPERERYQLTDEHLDELLMNRHRWDTWPGSKKGYSQEVLDAFSLDFVPELRVALERLPKDVEARKRGLAFLKGIYQDKLFSFYMNDYPDARNSEREPEYRENVRSTLEKAWEIVLDAAGGAGDAVSEPSRGEQPIPVAGEQALGFTDWVKWKSEQPVQEGETAISEIPWIDRRKMYLEYQKSIEG